MNPLKKNVLILTLFFLSVLNCNAQYIVAKKGDVVPFEKAVITNAPTFKTESRKITVLEELIASQKDKLDNLDAQIRVLNARIESEKETSKLLRQENDLTKAVLIENEKTLDDSLKKLKKQGRWYNKNSIWFAAGVGAAILLLK